METNVFLLPDGHLQDINLVYPSNLHLCSLIQNHIKLQMENNRYKDVHLYSGGRVTKLHSSLLSVWSPFFRSLQSELDPFHCRQSLDFLLPEFSHQELELFSQFIYSGELRIKQRQLGRIKALLKLFRISLVLEIYKAECKTELEEPPPVSPVNNLEDNETVNSNEIVVWELSSPTNINRAYPCDKCERVFQSSKSLNSHMQIQHLGTSKHQCDQCNKVFASKDTLGNHMRSHTGEYHECQCGKRFVCERDLNDHMNVHTGEKVFLCSVCGETFQTRKKMLNHKEKHKGSKQPCPVCGAILKSKACYAAHLKSHNQERIHSCKLCSRSFKRNYDLKVHMRAHTGAKPYNCDECGKPFSLSSTLSKHKRLFHANKTAVVYPCGICGQTLTSREEADSHTHQTEDIQESGPLEGSNSFQLDKNTLLNTEGNLSSHLNAEVNSRHLNAAVTSESSSLGRLVQLGIQNITQPLYVKFN